jgi:fumarate reductase subunit D
MIRRQAEPFLWLLFSAGGVASALVFPMFLLLVAVAMPLGWLPPPSHERLVDLVANPLVRLALFGVCASALFHWAHRFRYTLYDGLQIKHLNEVIALFCYGGALAGTVAAAYLLATFPG